MVKNTGNNKENLIYYSGVELFGKYGPRKVSIDMIVKDAGVAKGTFYLYFNNKEELYEQIVNDFIKEGGVAMKKMSENIPDIKERFMYNMIGTLSFFENNKIIKNLKDGNPDFYFGEITKDYVYNKHIGLVKILIGSEFEDNDKLVNMFSSVKGFYIDIINNKNHFKTTEDYEDFTLKLAAIMINGMFSDYDSVIKGRKFSDFTCKHCK